MKNTSYYLVEPSAHLQELLSSPSGRDLAAILPKSFLFSHLEGGQGTDTTQDRIAWAKLLFLAHLRQEYGTIPECRQLFEHARISIEEFDRYWKIERHLLEETFEVVEQGIDPETAALFSQTGAPSVDEWITGLQTSANSRTL